VLDGVTGFLVPSRDPHAVADRLAALHRDPALAHGMGQEGLRRAYQYYTWRTVAQQAAAIYSTVLEESRATSARATLSQL
jgi:glycosyltransferase involved in cell wall biosynthesis